MLTWLVISSQPTTQLRNSGEPHAARCGSGSGKQPVHTAGPSLNHTHLRLHDCVSWVLVATVKCDPGASVLWWSHPSPSPAYNGTGSNWRATHRRFTQERDVMAASDINGVLVHCSTALAGWQRVSAGWMCTKYLSKVLIRIN